MSEPTKIPLDVHAHLAPVAPERLAKLDGASWDADKGVMVLDGHVVGMKPLFKPEALLQWMDKNGVEHAWISAPPPLYREHLRGSGSRAWADYLNAGLHEIAKASSGRFTALMHLPTEQPAVAAEIAKDWIAKGHVLFSMPSGTGDERGLGDAEFAPLWQALDDASAFVFFHPGECADGRLQSFYLGNLLGNPYETTVALAHLVLSGVLERHRNFTFCFAHGGGLTPSAAARWDRGHDTARPDLDTKLAKPSLTLKRILVDCICHSEATATLAEETFGRDNVVFGSDWPFPMGLTEPHQQLASFSTERRNRYFNENPARLQARFSCKKG